MCTSPHPRAVSLGPPGCIPDEWAKHRYPHVAWVAVGHACAHQVWGGPHLRRPGKAVNMGHAHAAPYPGSWTILKKAAERPFRVSGLARQQSQKLSLALTSRTLWFTEKL